MNRSGVSKVSWALALWMFGVIASRAAEQPEWRVTLDIQMVTISPESALKLLPRLREPATFDKAFAEIQQMIERDEADLVAWPVIVAPRSTEFQIPNPEEIRMFISPRDESATSESIFEARYPSQYLPPQVPTTIGDPGSLALLFPIHPGDVTTLGAYETRSAGVSLVAGATVFNGGDLVELSVHPTRTLLLEYQMSRSPISPAGIIGGFPMPQFQIAQVNSHLTVRSGKRILLGTFVEEKPGAKVLLFLLKAVAARTGGKSSKP
jgi:hypothetical protein